MSSVRHMDQLKEVVFTTSHNVPAIAAAGTLFFSSVQEYLAKLRLERNRRQTKFERTDPDTW